MYVCVCVCINFVLAFALFTVKLNHSQRLQVKLTQMYHKVTYLDVNDSRSSNPRGEDKADSDTC